MCAFVHYGVNFCLNVVRFCHCVLYFCLDVLLFYNSTFRKQLKNKNYVWNSCHMNEANLGYLFASKRPPDPGITPIPRARQERFSYEKWCALHSEFEYSVRTSFLIFNSKSCFSDWNITIEWFYNDKPR